MLWYEKSARHFFWSMEKVTWAFLDFRAHSFISLFVFVVSSAFKLKLKVPTVWVTFGAYKFLYVSLVHLYFDWKWQFPMIMWSFKDVCFRKLLVHPETVQNKFHKCCLNYWWQQCHLKKYPVQCIPVEKFLDVLLVVISYHWMLYSLILLQSLCSWWKFGVDLCVTLLIWTVIHFLSIFHL